jgi:hypothetical protein
VVHTAESGAGRDGDALAVARFIQRRPDPGSYHVIVDEGGWHKLVDYDDEAFGDGTGGNRWALHLSFATRAALWDDMTAERRLAILTHGAAAAADMGRWLKAEHGVTVPARIITADQYRNDVAGFIGHGTIDPARRTDPGASFPWFTFLRLWFDATTKETTMEAEGPIADIQRMLNGNGVQPPLAIDGVAGPRTVAALDGVLRYLNHEVAIRDQRLAHRGNGDLGAIRAALTDALARIDRLTTVR